jgi:hypothetical protein
MIEEDRCTHMAARRALIALIHVRLWVGVAEKQKSRRYEAPGQEHTATSERAPARMARRLPPLRSMFGWGVDVGSPAKPKHNPSC